VHVGELTVDGAGNTAVNHRWMAMEPNRANPASRALIIRWNGLHFVRTMLGAVAVALFLIGFLGY
jgi:hypothetical protein